MSSNPAPSDEDLIEGYYACEDEPFNELSRRYWPQLVAFFRGQGVQATDADDLTAQVLFRVVRTKERGTGRYHRGHASGAGFRSWLMRIATNVLHDFRGRPRYFVSGLPEVEGETVITWEADEAPSPEDLAEASEMEQRIDDCLQRLRPIHREVLELSMAGHDLASIATILAIPYATAGTRLHHARQQMARCLGEDRFL